MKALIEISNKTIGAQAVQSVLAKDLYLGLGLGKGDWSRWYPTNIEKNEFFTENKDWVDTVLKVKKPEHSFLCKIAVF